ncbi:hypothetical protein KZJ38_25225 [Paraburkholderia edwinii]|jgi:hypothetical protein|uniref:Uncharacterized protein n=2 Tax=Paraburkholderia edwinii TaxID=2861782 RepID=A0ABX8UXR4_9BURK|nr:hypothetical protein KZJ38_25225 [Paraburkholderia edwinii]
MRREYDYRGFLVEVMLETEYRLPTAQRSASTSGFLAVVRVLTKAAVPLLTPLRLGDTDGAAFATEGDALMGGYAAGQRLVDDLLSKPV